MLEPSNAGAGALRAARLAKGWKAAKLAARLGVSTTTLSRWENGHQKPSSFNVEQICEVFGLSPSALGLDEPEQFVPQSRARSHLEQVLDEWGVPVGNRRGFLRNIAAAVGLAALAPLLELGDGEPLHRLAVTMQRPRRVDLETVEHLEAVTAAQRELYHHLTSEELIGAVTGHLRVAKLLLQNVQQAEPRRRLGAIVTEAAGHAAWLSYDLNDNRAGDHYYALAGMAARDAGDTALGAYVQGFKSLVRADEGKVKVALALAEEASHDAAPSAGATMQAWLAGLEAQPLATMGESKGCYQALRRAEVAIQKADPDEDPPWMYGFDASRLQGLAGSCYRRLGKTAAAERSLLDAMASLPGSCSPHGCARRRAEFLLELAWVQLDQGNIDEACGLLSESLQGTLAAGSMMGLKRIRDFRIHLEPWDRTKAVAALDEQLAGSF